MEFERNTYNLIKTLGSDTELIWRDMNTNYEFKATPLDVFSAESTFRDRYEVYGQISWFDFYTILSIENDEVLENYDPDIYQGRDLGWYSGCECHSYQREACEHIFFSCAAVKDKDRVIFEISTDPCPCFFRECFGIDSL